MAERKPPESYPLSDRAHLILECADRGWLRHLNGLTCWTVSPERGCGLRITVTAATGQKLVRDGLLELTSSIECRLTKYGRNVLAPRRRMGWELEAGVGHKPRLKQTTPEPAPSEPPTYTVVVMEPCCYVSAPDFVPPPKPVHIRTPGDWSGSRCTHAVRRIPTITVHTTRESADPEYAKTLGWHSLPGYLYEGVMPPEGERFRIMRVGGNSISGHHHGEPGTMPFPTAEFAAEYAEKTRGILYNIVGDQDTRVRLSSYCVPVGTELEPGWTA